nr:reverse transcriptase domain-containing protein [Tanacetum cinerariifolium]
SRADPTLLNDFEMATEGNGDPPVPDLRTIEELCQPTLNGRGGPIAQIAIQATNFGLKNDMIQQVQNSCQFHRLPGDDANKHLDKFLHVTQSIKVNGVIADALRLYLFPHSLTRHVTAWFDRLPRNSINTFEQMAKMFLGKYFPPSMVTKLLRNEITNFRQRPDESLFEAWERYKLLIDRCPNHNMLPITQIDTLYNGLTLRHRDTINAAAGGTFMKRRPEEYYDLIKNITAHHNDWDTSAQRIESSSSITSFDPKIVALKAEMAEINKNLMKVLQINQQVKAVTPSYETSGGPHSYNDCSATVIQTQNVYAAGAYQGGNSYQPQGTLPSNTVTNSKEDLKGITTRSETAYQGPTIPTTTSSSPPQVVESETEVTKDTMPSTNNKSTKDIQPPIVQTETPIPNSEHVVAPVAEPVVAPISAPKPHQKPLIPYSSRLHDQKLCDKANVQKEKFFQIFKDLDFNISFTDALILMLKFGLAIKSLLTNKDKLFELDRTPLNEHCLAVLLKKLPEKLGDPGKFLIPCDFSGMDEWLALANLGASINLMPLSVWNKLSLLEHTPTLMTLELADRHSFFPPANTIPRHSRRKTTNVVEPEFRTNVTMADNRTMAQMLQAPIKGYEDAIVTLVNLVQSNQFTERQDPHNHLRFFNKVTSTFRHPEEPPRSILTWEDLVSKFINQFFPPSKTTYLRNKIINFLQKPNEKFNEAWERFKDLLCQCPHHGFSELHQFDTFYNALNPNDQDALDSAAGGNFLDKIPRECLSIIESKSKVRSGMSYKEPQILPPGVDQQEPIEVTTDTELPSPKDIQPLLVQVEVQVDKPAEEPSVVIPKAKANLPYPCRLQKEKLQENDDILAAKFMEIFRALHFELGFADALVHMPKFAPMFKKILNNKDKLIELTKTPLNENCSAVRLRLPTLNDTKMVLELDDRTISKPTGVVENVFVKVGKFYFPADFVFLDFVADPRVLLILGRLFLSIAHAIINVFKREIIIRQNQQSLTIQCSNIPSVKKVEQINKLDFINAGGIDFELEEIENFLNDDSIPFGVEDSPFNMDEDILFLESLLRDDPIPPHLIILNQTKLPIKETNHSLNMGYEHFNTNLSTEHINDNSSDFMIISNPLFDNDKINSDEINLHVEFNSDESTSKSNTVKSDYLDEFYEPFIPIYILEEERTRREHADYINRMEMFFTINPRPHNSTNDITNIESFSSFPILNQESKPRQEEIDVVSVTNDVLPPSDDDSDEQVDVGDLRVDNFIQNSKHEYSESDDSDFDNPLLPLPPSEPPDKEFDFEKEILVEFSLLFAESEDTIFDPGISE